MERNIDTNFVSLDGSLYRNADCQWNICIYYQAKLIKKECQNKIRKTKNFSTNLALLCSKTGSKGVQLVNSHLKVGD